MVSVASLLNPLPPSFGRLCDSSTPTPSIQSPTPSSSSKRPRMSKPTAIFVKADPKGKINYRPCEIQDDTIRAEHVKFQVEPIGHISEYPRHIPYNSQKKSFQQKTGRDAFEAYQYTFRMPNEDREKEPHAVMWDYNVGLVRITSFFKSLKHSKTMPAKVMNANPGLKEISHSITGGSINAQGYWVPYEAARAIAATFCWEIRYALTPVFGLEFPCMCTEPNDPAFLRISIDQDIVLRCTQTANANRVTSQRALQTGSQRPPFASNMKTLRPRPAIIQESESGYCTDTDRSLPNSPEWTPVEIPRSVGVPYLPPHQPRASEYSSSSPSTVSIHGQSISMKRRRSSEIETTDGTAFETTISVTGASRTKRTKFSTPTQEARAAYMLMQLHMADAALASKRRQIRRRASH
ncbi:MAG: hypothetical protein Q9163_005643 [Psora crenata]